MIKVSVLYPYKQGATFDMAYYITKHLPMVQQLVPACKGITAERGVGGAEPGSKPTYLAGGHLLFETVEAFQSGFGPHATQILGDIPNYTTIQPIVQISEITL